MGSTTRTRLHYTNSPNDKHARHLKTTCRACLCVCSCVCSSVGKITSGVFVLETLDYTRKGSNKGKTPEHHQAKHTKHPHSLEWHNSTITIIFPSPLRNTLVVMTKHNATTPNQRNVITRNYVAFCCLARSGDQGIFDKQAYNSRPPWKHHM